MIFDQQMKTKFGIFIVIALVIFVWYARQASIPTELESASSSASTSSLGELESESSTAPVESLDPSALVNQVNAGSEIGNSQQLKVIDEILASKNDNDPRIDTELRVLDEMTKAGLRGRYQQLPLEQRNARGTLVFLIGRNLTSARDFEFMKDVLSELPCLSLEDCSQAPNSSIADNHHEGSTAVTLAYPQMVALYSLERALKNSQGELRNNPELKAEAMAALQVATNSRIPEVSKMAASLERQLQAR